MYIIHAYFLFIIIWLKSQVLNSLECFVCRLYVQYGGIWPRLWLFTRRLFALLPWGLFSVPDSASQYVPWSSKVDRSLVGRICYLWCSTTFGKFVFFKYYDDDLMDIFNLSQQFSHAPCLDFSFSSILSVIILLSPIFPCKNVYFCF